jgi:hypothetical protein
MRESAGAPLPAAERGDVDRVVARARSALGREAFAAMIDEGSAMTLDDHRQHLRSAAG